MNNNFRKVIISLLILSLLFIPINSVFAAPIAGANTYNNSWSEFLGPGAGYSYFTQTATYDNNSFVIYLSNMSGTKYWNNYHNYNGTVQQVTYGISQSHTEATTYSYKKTVDLGFVTIPYLNKLAEAVGGEFTYSKYYSKTEGTSSAYVLNTESKNGYYAVCHCVQADRYDTTEVKTGNAGGYTKNGKWYRYTTNNGYEAIRYSTSPF